MTRTLVAGIAVAALALSVVSAVAQVASSGNPAPWEGAAAVFGRKQAFVAGLRDLYATLLSVRRDLPPGDADAIDFDEHAGWLRVRRGPYVLVASFSRRPSHVPLDGSAELIAGTPHVTLEPGYVALGPLSGALVKLG